MREYWENQLIKMASPVIEALANNQLKLIMPIEHKRSREGDKKSAYMEAVGRLFCGIAPYIELAHEDGGATEELKIQIRTALTNGLNPNSPDYLWIDNQHQLLVDIAFLAHALVRAPNELFYKLSDEAKENLKDLLLKSRQISPGNNNWILFSGMVEVALEKFFNMHDVVRTAYCARQFDAWYLGDGTYGDGQFYANDYYNSFVIQPMLLEIYETFDGRLGYGQPSFEKVIERAKRYAQIQERLINCDGSYPIVGRSIAYRGGAFHHLATMALKDNLPDDISKGQVRCALTAVIERTLSPANTYNDKQFLNIGVCGKQSSCGEVYINTGSAYLASFIFLPLGLSKSNEFWTAPDEFWTSKKIWNGIDFKVDYKID